MSNEPDDERVSVIRGELERHRVELRRELDAQGADPDTDDVTFVDDHGFSDRSHSTEERSRLISVVRALRSNLRDVDRALIKIRAGAYGSCERCGRIIDPERLEAIPWALLCIECKRKAGA